MKFKDFIKDRITVYIIFAIAISVIGIFLRALSVQSQIIILISSIIILSTIISELWDYFRKKTFYNDLEHFLGELDKKYLLPETITEPDFYDGKKLYSALQVSNKSMHENVVSYRTKNDNFREYIEMWAHEAKIPLSSLRLMCHNNPTIEDKLIEQIKRLENNVDNVLYYARSESPEKDYLIKEASLKKIVSNVLGNNREVLQLIDAKVDTENLDISVLTDSKWIEYVLNQFITNSVKYRHPNRNLIIKVWAETFDDKIVFHFKDNGRGIPSSDLPYIFEKFFTGSNGRGTTKSTGMGLYIAKKMCDRMGHSIKADAVQGEYTDISISFTKDDYYKMQQ